MNITVHDGPDAVCAVSGEADADNCNRIGEALLGRSFSSSTVALDLQELTFIDSSAISELLRVHAALAEDGINLVMTKVSAPVQRVLEITGLLGTFGLAADGEVS